MLENPCFVECETNVLWHMKIVVYEEGVRKDFTNHFLFGLHFVIRTTDVSTHTPRNQVVHAKMMGGLNSLAVTSTVGKEM